MRIGATAIDITPPVGTALDGYGGRTDVSLGVHDPLYARALYLDDGTTQLGDMSTTSKLDLRLAAYADVDEANSHIGVAISLGTLTDDVVAVLTHVQNDLFDVGADLSCPIEDHPKHPPLRVEPDYVERLEGWCDEYNEPLEKLRSFILPGGTQAAAQLHVARTVTRRAERSAWRPSTSTARR